MTIAILSHPDCELHNIPGHPEQPARVKVIEQALKQYPFKTPVKFVKANRATREQLIGAHTENHVDWIFSISPKSGEIEIDADTHMTPFTLNAALHAAGAVTQAVDMVMDGQVNAAFCNVRPPGHHAEADKAMGFCIFNNVAVGVKHAINQYQLERIAIIDFDVHHGNGTQNIFQMNKKVMLCSSFQHPFYPGYESEMDNEHILSVPLAAGTNGDEYREKVKAAWFDKLDAFQPQFIFFSAGFDAHTNDPLANINLTKADYVWLTEEIAKLANKHCNGKIVSALEGGYDLKALAESVPAHVDSLKGPTFMQR